MSSHYDLDFWVKQLRLAIINHFTGTQDAMRMESDHFKILSDATVISVKTLRRFVLEEHRPNLRNRNALAGYLLEGIENYDDLPEEEKDFFLRFMNGEKPDSTSKKKRANKTNMATNWLGQEKLEFMVYEAAFLWHDQEPPAIESHHFLMTRKIQETKEMLHAAINQGELTVTRQVLFNNGGVTRWLSKEALKKYAEKLGQRPSFLFGNE